MEGGGFELWSSIPAQDFGVHKIVMNDLAYEHVTDTLFTYCCTKIQILFLI